MWYWEHLWISISQVTSVKLTGRNILLTWIYNQSELIIIFNSCYDRCKDWCHDPCIWCLNMMLASFMIWSCFHHSLSPLYFKSKSPPELGFSVGVSERTVKICIKKFAILINTTCTKDAINVRRQNWAQTWPLE